MKSIRCGPVFRKVFFFFIVVSICLSLLILFSCGNAEFDTRLLRGVAYEQAGEYEKAISIYKSLSEEGNKIAQCNMSMLYYRGTGVDRDYCASYELAKKSSLQDYGPSDYIMGLLFYHGKCVEQNYETALAYFERAVENGYSAAKHNIGVIYYHGYVGPSDYSKSFRLFMENTEDPLSVYYVGRHYYFGKGVEKNYSKARSLLEQAASDGCGNAESLLGTMYYKGYGVERDFEVAHDLFSRAIEKGVVAAKCDLGILYATKGYRGKDFSKAHELLREAASSGHRKSMYMLGFLYENGIGVSANIAEALRWYTKSSDLGYLKARHKVSMLGSDE